MFKSGGLFFPKGEHHFTKYGDAVVDYQKADRDVAYSYVKGWRRALDAGANVGIFSRDFATRFDEVVAFEPMPLTRECLEANVPDNVRIEAIAVADQPGVLQMCRTGSSGGSFICNHPGIMIPDMVIRPERRIDVEVRTIDSYDFDAVDLIKFDVQGAEYLALLGARETILRHRPVIMIEEKVSTQGAEHIKMASDLLLSLGMTAKEKAQADRVYIFES